MQKTAKFKVGDKVDYYRRGICYSGIVRQDLGILKGAGRRYRITPPEDGKHDLEWFVFDVAERHLSCDCKYENSVQCIAHKLEV
jgi:hypothetical protein